MTKKKIRKLKKTTIKNKKSGLKKIKAAKQKKRAVKTTKSTRKKTAPVSKKIRKVGASGANRAPRREKTVNFDGVAKKIIGRSDLKKSAVSVSSPKVLIALGDLVSVVYRRDADGKTYIHKFAKSAPKLSVSEKNKLFIVGGNYRVNERGII